MHSICPYVAQMSHVSEVILDAMSLASHLINGVRGAAQI